MKRTTIELLRQISVAGRKFQETQLSLIPARGQKAMKRKSRGAAIVGSLG